MGRNNKYAEVYIDIKAFDIDHAFDYRIPPDLSSDIDIGRIVQVPFKNRIEVGYIVKIKDESELKDREIKDILKIVEKRPVFNPERLELINWISEYYIQPPGSVIKFFLPPGGKYKQAITSPRVQLKFKDFITLNRNRYNQLKDKINWKRNSSQKKIIDYLISGGEVLKEKLVKDTGSSYSSLASLADKNIISIVKKRQKRDFRYEYRPGKDLNKKKIILNSYQKNALRSIDNAIQKNIFHKFLIEGVTGSGKTDIYIAACRKVIEKKKRALILTPEISLIPQLFSRFESELGSRVCVYHSNMNEAERYERWLGIWENEFDVIIGTRSSIFTPIGNLGMIILDEEHDPSYKEGTRVRYNTQDVAIKLGEILNIPVVMGSATPNIVTRYRAEKENDFTLLKIPVKAQSSSPLETQVVDLKKIDRLKEDVAITAKLFTAIREELEKNNKVIIFLNRRGYSNFVICNKCGSVPKCSACDLSYNYHSDRKKLVCHHCGREQNYTGRCLVCGADNIFLYGTGIQRVQSKLQMRFKNTPILRMDSDITVKKKSHQEILSKFISPGGSILIGTQMVAKGLDIEDVTLVGVINCDSMLGLPDYHMNERVYQLITQVSGRAGRKRKKGRVIIQTYNPESSVMKNVLGNDYESFYRQELASRKELCYPPFSNLINIIISGKEENKVKKDIKELFAEISKENRTGSNILGPAPAPFYKINLFYRWHIIIKSKNIEYSNKILTKILKRFKKFDENKIIIDVDPVWIL
ncbi:MAG: primosomal protein N' [Actinobacteria bacterium]|nr:primosomal protein N' [Actinomycetota bacterium]MBL7123552.1 primosomal protein N' [Actinomycetota bacterium]